MAGTWRHQRHGPRLEIEVRPFAPLPGWACEGAEAEAEGLAGFLGGALALRWA